MSSDTVLTELPQLLSTRGVEITCAEVDCDPVNLSTEYDEPRSMRLVLMAHPVSSFEGAVTLSVRRTFTRRGAYLITRQYVSSRRASTQ
jgi:hypothetical protein